VLAAAILLAAIVTGCADDGGAPSDAAARFGYTETVQGRALAEEAIAAANLILGPSRTIELVGAWQEAPNGAAERRSVRVQLLAPDQLPKRLFLVVPARCDCVFLQPHALTRWLDDRTTARPDQMLTVDRALLLAFMLLHEVGHVVDDHPGQFETTAAGGRVNFEASEQKVRETEADRFVIEQIKAAATPSGKNVSRWLAATRLQTTLANLAWNLSAIRYLDHFGATTLATPSVFGDATYTHPNFELRLLTVNHALWGDNASQVALQAFEERRRRASEPPAVLYRREP
jgi:hypothetical protein